MLKGWRTVIVGLGMAIGLPALQYLGAVDWTQYVSPGWAPFIAGAVMVALRYFTTGPVGTTK